MDEKEVRFRKLLDAANKAKKTWSVSVTRFFDPSEAQDAARAAYEAGCGYTLYGGYDGAERSVCAYHPEGEEPDKASLITRVHISWNEKYGSASHRDILGALMGLGIERECTGDIVVGKDGAELFVSNEIGDWVVTQLESCGRAHVKCSVSSEPFEPPEPEGTVKRITVASLRLDAFISEALDISRSKASELIKAGLVKKQFAECIKPDSEVNEGDLVSVRGYGRVKLVTIDGETKKGRVGAHIFLYASTKTSK